MNIKPWERNYRNGNSQLFFKIGVLKNFGNFKGKHLCVGVSLSCRSKDLQFYQEGTPTEVAWERNYRSSCLNIFFKIAVLKNFANFTGKTPVLESLFHIIAGLKTYNFIKKRLQHRCHEKETTEAIARIYSSK